MFFYSLNPCPNFGVHYTTSGRVTGVLSKKDGNRPSETGTLVYINASPNIQAVLDRVKKVGGTIITQKIKIPAGFIAVIKDSEGNKVGLHSSE